MKIWLQSLKLQKNVENIGRVITLFKRLENADVDFSFIQKFKIVYLKKMMKLTPAALVTSHIYFIIKLLGLYDCDKPLRSAVLSMSLLVSCLSHVMATFLYSLNLSLSFSDLFLILFGEIFWTFLKKIVICFLMLIPNCHKYKLL